ncbi:succinyl-diaminopimelate desuccinylase [Cryobacterium sp. MP_M5]|uniref:M20/M25/M40 family metallo-hydrolase n=1 Tax=unclassified Cryobacterium TaxID=2649013 RepID=UPI001A1AB578|nr:MULTISPECIES: M20/M25/M40 family metallo-hydrolase [unclassified Cryobacterium]MBG6059630.1 acetylornithine deacetylase [Cryobacterium sp. MP_M3]MEC5177672.1 succinyl-diaminopimelate desuccinylase [Cryobacterium sp. MP_M5]
MTSERSGAGTSGADDPIDLMRRLIGIDSVNPDLVPGAAGEVAIADWCARWLEGHGFEVHRLEERPGRPSIVAIFRGSGGGRSLMLNGHLDTVGVAGYDGDPFSGERRGGRVLGRGAFDMKGGVAAILVAAARASAAGLPGDVLVTLVADEEFGSLGTMEVLRSHRADAAIVAEPSELCLTLAHRGFAWFELELIGLAAHGSQPERGVDAIAHAGLVLRALDGLREQIEAGPAHPLLGHGTVRVSMIRGGTDAATVAATCTLTIERRTLPGETPDDVEAELRGLLTAIAERTADFRFRLTRLVARAAFEADPDWSIVRLARAEAGRVLGHPPATRGEPFWTDAGLLHEAGIPCLVIGVAGGGAHAAEEWAEEVSVLQLTEILAGTIAGFCA